MLGIETEPASGATQFVKVVRDTMLVAWRPSAGNGETGGDGCVVLAYSGEGLAWWMNDVSPNIDHWRYTGVPELEGRPAGLYVWEGWVEGGDDDSETWAGDWRVASSRDLIRFDLAYAHIPDVVAEQVRAAGRRAL
jgi:hypothetical protein